MNARSPRPARISGRQLTVGIAAAAGFAVLLGVAEELLFRGALYGWLRKRLSAPAAITATTALFALEHGFTPS